MPGQPPIDTERGAPPRDSRSFGHAGRYYAVGQSEALRAAQRSPSPLERHFAEFLKKHEPELKARVERAFKQWNNILRDHLRNETGLRLTVGDDAQAVPVRIEDGFPESFAKVVERFDEDTWTLLLNRAVLHEGVRALAFLRREFGWIKNWLGAEPCPAEYEEVRHVEAFLYFLLRRLRIPYFIERIRAIQEDVLGAYFFRLPEVRLYWMVIGFLSGVLGVSVEALTVVVATHELTHAYTHLGRDIDGGRWATENFAAANLAITEGLAQFYTKVICKKLETRFPSGWEAYERLLKLQSGPYLVHEDWTEGNEAIGEVVRISMITCRSTNTVRPGRFEVIRRQQAGRLGKVQRQDIRTTGEAAGHKGNAPTPTLPKAVMDALLWVGKYYYGEGVNKKDEWCEIVQVDMGPEVTTAHLDYAWDQIADHSTKKEPSIDQRPVPNRPVTASAGKTSNSRALLASIVAELRAVPGALSGDDSDDAWEEIKEQVQQERSLIWPVYLETIKQVIDGAVGRLAPTELLALSSGLKVPTGDRSRTERALLRRLLAKARMEKIRYEPFDFEYFRYTWSGISIYTQILNRTGMHTCWVAAYSSACPPGEQGEIDLDQIDRTTDIHIMEADDFEKARSLNWPDQWVNPARAAGTEPSEPKET
ncbi:MAG TPA: hypothetical protein VG204_02695 [Terriglobia bacterium]|nr:hypothetical protein [Terriglobia bacterium]